MIERRFTIQETWSMVSLWTFQIVPRAWFCVFMYGRSFLVRVTLFWDRGIQWNWWRMSISMRSSHSTTEWHQPTPIVWGCQVKNGVCPCWLGRFSRLCWFRKPDLHCIQLVQVQVLLNYRITGLAVIHYNDNKYWLCAVSKNTFPKIGQFSEQGIWGYLRSYCAQFRGESTKCSLYYSCIACRKVTFRPPNVKLHGSSIHSGIVAYVEALQAWATCDPGLTGQELVRYVNRHLLLQQDTSYAVFWLPPLVPWLKPFLCKSSSPFHHAKDIA